MSLRCLPASWAQCSYVEQRNEICIHHTSTFGRGVGLLLRSESNHNIGSRPVPQSSASHAEAREP